VGIGIGGCIGIEGRGAAYPPGENPGCGCIAAFACTFACTIGCICCCATGGAYDGLGGGAGYPGVHGVAACNVGDTGAGVADRRDTGVVSVTAYIVDAR
jgi:hypothetical protein